MRFVLFCPVLMMLAALTARPATNCETNPESPWCTAKTVYISAKSDFMREAELERGILQSAEFGRSGLRITRAKMDADLVLEVRRKPFTSQFTISVIDRRNQVVLASDRANSIGGHIEPKLARKFARIVKAYR